MASSFSCDGSLKSTWDNAIGNIDSMGMNLRLVKIILRATPH